LINRPARRGSVDPRCIIGHVAVERVTRDKDGRPWRIGTAAHVAWIDSGTGIGLTITSAIPPAFEAYATVLAPEDIEENAQHEREFLSVLRDHTEPDQPWWLGFLDTGADDIVFPDAPKVSIYADWPYVLVEAGPEQAGTWRDPESWRGALPDLIFPADRSWLVSYLWDDEWRCVGGPTALIDALQRIPSLTARRVSLGEDATPPGHAAR
jgi:hypothetical protein